MNKNIIKEQDTQDQGINIQRAFWVTLIFSLVAFSSFILAFVLTFSFRAWQIYTMASIAGLSTVGDIVALILIRRGRTIFATKILYWSTMIVLPLNTLLLTNVALSLIGITLIMGFVVVYFLIPASWRKLYPIGPVVAAAVMGLIEFLHPAFRYNMSAVPSTPYWGPIMVGFLMIATIVVLVRQSIIGATTPEPVEVRTDRHANFFQRLVQPVPSLTDPSRRRQVSLVSTLALAVAVALVSGTLANQFILHQSGLAIFLGVAAVAMAITYVLSRTKYYALAQALLLGFLLLISWLDVFTQNDYSASGLLGVFVFNVIVILIASILIPLRYTIFLAGANFLYLLILPVVFPQIKLSNELMPMLYNVIVSVLILVLAQNRNLSERDHLAELNTVNRTLQANNETLDLQSQALNNRTKALTTSAEVSRRLSTILSQSQLVNEVVEQIQTAFGYYHVHIYLIDEASGDLIMAGGTGEAGRTMLANGHKIQRGRGLVGRAAETKDVVLVPDTTKDPAWLPNPLLPETKSEVAVPIQMAENVLGVLDVQNNIPESLSQQDADMIRAIANQVAIALQNIRQYQEIQHTSAQLSEALDISRLANWEYDVEKDIFHFNDHFYSIFHTTAEAMGGYELSSAQYAERLVYPEDLPVVGKEIEKALNSTDKHYSAHVEHRVAYADGGMGYISVIIHIDRDDQGHILRYYGANQDITERKLAEEKLRASEAQLSEALDISKLANWDYDVEKDIFHFNDHFYSIFHTTAEAMGGYELSSAQYAERLVYPEDLPVVGKEIEKALNSTDKHYSAQVEHRVAYADGGMGYISVIIHIDRDDQGHILRYYGANQDITERKLAEEKLRASEAQLSEALDISKLANWDYDVEKDIFHFNDHFYSIFHTTAEAMGGYDLSSAQYAERLVYPEDLPVVGKEIGKALNSTDKHYSAQVEHRVAYSDGGMGYISVIIHIDRDDQGHILRYYGANQDITERKLAEERVRESEERLNTILATVPTAIAISRVKDGTLMYANPSFGTLLGYDEKELTGKHTPDFYYDPADRQKLFKELDARGSLVGYELRTKHADGHMFYVLLYVHPIKFYNEECLLFSASDFTQRKQDEETLGKRATELELAARVSTAAATIIDSDRLLQEVVDLTKQSFNLYHAHIYLLNEAGDTLQLRSGAGEVGRTMVSEGRSIPLNREQSLVARAARTRLGVIVNNVRTDPDFLPHPLLPETRSELAVPMIVGDKVIGVFDVQSDQVDHFTQEDVRIQSTLAAQVSVAIQNASTYSKAQQQAERETALNVIGQKIQAATSVEAVLQIAARELGRALNAPLTVAQLGLKDKKNGGDN